MNPIFTAKTKKDTLLKLGFSETDLQFPKVICLDRIYPIPAIVAKYIDNIVELKDNFAYRAYVNEVLDRLQKKYFIKLPVDRQTVEVWLPAFDIEEYSRLLFDLNSIGYYVESDKQSEAGNLLQFKFKYDIHKASVYTQDASPAQLIKPKKRKTNVTKI